MMFNWLSLLAGLCYIALGIFVMIKKSFILVAELDANIAYGVGTVLIIYGLFRIYRAIFNLKNTENED